MTRSKNRQCWNITHYSSRITDGHGTNFFGRTEQAACQWAEAEAKAGFTAWVAKVTETVIHTFVPQIKGE